MTASERPSPNFDDRPADTPIDMVVLHYTGMESAAAALEHLCDAGARVSAHYVIDEDGTVISLVSEDKRAWHAGEAYWRGKTDINGCSVGVELVNPGHQFGYRDFPDPQMAALAHLAKEIQTRHSIPPRNIVGHSDISPRRKIDPGELFDWEWLAGMGVGLWPKFPGTFKKSGPSVEVMLEEIGYETISRDASIMAFQRHFRPQKIDRECDGETMSLVKGLLELVA